MSKIASTILVMIAGATAGCGGLTGTRTGSLYDRDGVDVIADAPEARFVWVKPASSGERFCLAPDPDTVLSATASADVDVKLASQSTGDPKLAASETAANLGGRTPAVVMLRELMYRACEMSSNVGASAEETRAIYGQFLQAATQLVGQPAAAGTAGSPAPAN